MSYISQREIEKRLADVLDATGDDDFLSRLTKKQSEQVLAAFIFYKRALGYRFDNPSRRKNFRVWNGFEADIVQAHLDITYHAQDLREGCIAIAAKPACKNETFGMNFIYPKENFPFWMSDDAVARNLIYLYGYISGGIPRTVTRALMMRLTFATTTTQSH